MSGNTDDQIIAGNFYDKYATQNPIAKYLMHGFFASLNDLIKKANANQIHEIGCGEGNLSARLARQGYKVLGTDFSKDIICTAQQQWREESLKFQVASVYDLEPSIHSAPLILCCEVLEHLEEPEHALQKISELQFETLILSVPREPIWCLMNMARGKYWSDMGNTPGHIQNWSKHRFLNMVASYFSIQEIKSPLPWTMVSCTKRE